MKYFEVVFKLDVDNQVMEEARDVVAALAGEAGFETFEETPNGLKGYVQQTLFDEEALKSQLAFFPFDGATVSYTVRKAEDKDWNEQWEQEGFTPIIVDKRCIIHDGRHLEGYNSRQYDYNIEIDAHMAFGTGTHETTRMIVSELIICDIQGKRMLDCGCGTGILAIAALKMGAASATGYDIDEWSVDNSRHNAVINKVDDRFTLLHGDAMVLDTLQAGSYDLVAANINRNILLADMEHFFRMMAQDAILLLSGFYQEDIPLLKEKAMSLQLKFVRQRAEGDWACLTFKKTN